MDVGTMLRLGSLAALLELTACGGSQTELSPPGAGASGAAETPSANLQPLGVEGSSIYLGAWVNPTGSQGGSASQVASFEAQIGRKLALDMHYYGWKSNFPAANEADDAQNGRIPVISWNCGVSNATVAAGAQDDLIRQRADAIKAYGKTVFLRYLWEMNLPASDNGRSGCYDPATDAPNGFFSPAEFIAAWRHIWQIFAQEGVTNVVWLWNPSAGGNPPLPYYPGSEYVHWAGMDTYDMQNISFTQTFAALYPLLAPLGKDILIAETGATQSNQSTFFSQAVPALKSTYPQVKGFVYFDAAGPRADWVLSGDGLAAFATMAGDPYLSASQ